MALIKEEGKKERKREGVASWNLPPFSQVFW
jgi:hypothetical protein